MGVYFADTGTTTSVASWKRERTMQVQMRLLLLLIIIISTSTCRRRLRLRLRLRPRLACGLCGACLWGGAASLGRDYIQASRVIQLLVGISLHVAGQILEEQPPHRCTVVPKQRSGAGHRPGSINGGPQEATGDCSKARETARSHSGRGRDGCKSRKQMQTN